MRHQTVYELQLFDKAGSKGSDPFKATGAAFELAHANHFAQWQRELVAAGIPTWRVQ